MASQYDFPEKPRLNLTAQSISSNFSEYIVQPEEEGSPFTECVAILLKTDFEVVDKAFIFSHMGRSL